MSNQASFSSRWALMFAMLSMAVGTGNVWRFPRVVARNDGGTFLVPWVIFLVIWSIPLILTEFALGRAMQAGPLGALVRLIGPRFAWMGGWITATAVAIMFYYSVVTGWVLRYLVASLTGELRAADPQAFFDNFIASRWPLVAHVVVMLLALAVIYRGVGAIERVTSIMLPSLIALVVVLAIRAATLPGASRGLAFMFHVEWAHLADHRIWLEALTQNAWDTGAGWGLITAYAIYMRPQDDGSVNGFLLGIGNNLVSLTAGVAVLCTIFSIMPEAREKIVDAGNEGLTFVWIPQLFARIPAGGVFMVFFFAALFMAAWTSLVAMVELAARGLEDIAIPRRVGLPLVAVAGLLGGVPSALSIDVLHNQDWVWGLALLVSGLFFAIAVLTFGVRRFRENLVDLPGNQMRIGRWWEVLIGGLVPLEAVALLAWWFWQTFPAAAAGVTMGQRLRLWLTPWAIENTGTALFQWAIVLAALLLANAWLARRVQR